MPEQQTTQETGADARGDNEQALAAVREEAVLAERQRVSEIQALPSPGVDVVFDSIGGSHIWRSRKALRRGGKVVAYGLTGSLSGGRVTSGRSGGRHPYRAIAIFGLYIAASWVLPGRKRVAPYSIQTLKQLKPTWFREDLIALLDLLQQEKIKPLIAYRLPLTEARQAHELLGKGGVTGKIVLVCDSSHDL